MKKCSFKPYEGNEPYIFVSYAHKDSGTVFPILDALVQRGYRVWYDDGIAPGSEWPENIAHHLNGCALTLAFVSNNSMASPNCRREITFALSKKKPFLSVMLEPTELSPGMELQLSAQQCVMRYGYTDQEQFLSKLCSCPDLQPCLAPPAAHVEEEPPRQIPTPPPKPKPTPKKPSLPKKAWIGIGIGAVAVVAVILLIVLLAQGQQDQPEDPGASTTRAGTSTVTVLPGYEFDSEAESVTLTDVQITEDAVAQLNKLTQLEFLYFENCEFLTAPDLNLPELFLLNFTGCTGTQYLQALDGLSNLHTLEIEGSTLTDSDIPVFDLPALQDFVLTNTTDFTDLSKLSNCTGLDEVTVDGTGVADLSILSQCKDIRYIRANDCPVSSIDCLAPLEDLAGLSFNNCQIESVTEPFKSLRMETLEFFANPLQDISGFDNLTVLTTVNFGYTQLSSMDCVEKSVDTLLYANLSGISYSAADIVSRCVHLIELYIDGTFLYDCDDLAALTDLEVLSAEGCDIYLTDGLHNCTKLRDINLTANGIDDISFVGKLDPNVSLTLDLTLNDLQDVSALRAINFYDGLSLLGNAVDFSTANGLSGNLLILSYNETLTPENLPDGLDFYTVYVIDCPDDQKVAVEDLLTGSSVTFMSSSELDL